MPLVLILNPDTHMKAQPEIHQDEESGNDLVKRSSLYQEFLAEREEILRHKWVQSEKAGHDIGFERALLNWIRFHRDEWRTKRRMLRTVPSEK